MNQIEPTTDPYPNARNGILWFEAAFPPDRNLSDLSHIPIAKIIEGMHNASRPEVEKDYTPESWMLIQRADKEYDTDDFRKYLMARIYGAM